jgi:hypothetical protein
MRHTPTHPTHPVERPMPELRRLGARHPLTVTRGGKVVELMTSIAYLNLFQRLTSKDEWPDVVQPQVRMGK